jgi:hypothetical protein
MFRGLITTSPRQVDGSLSIRSKNILCVIDRNNNGGGGSLSFSVSGGVVRLYENAVIN